MERAALLSCGGAGGAGRCRGAPGRWQQRAAAARLASGPGRSEPVRSGLCGVPPSACCLPLRGVCLLLLWFCGGPNLWIQRCKSVVCDIRHVHYLVLFTGLRPWFFASGWHETEIINFGHYFLKGKIMVLAQPGDVTNELGKERRLTQILLWGEFFFNPCKRERPPVPRG